MAFFSLVFGIIGFSFGLISYSRMDKLDKLEKRLKELGVLEPDYNSDEEF